MATHVPRICALVGLGALAACSASPDAAPAPPPLPATSSAGADAGSSVDHDGGGATPGDEGGVAHGDGGASEADGAPAAAARGATLPYIEYEAEDAATNGTILGPSRAVNDPDLFNSIAGESSGRRAVKLAGPGQYVRFTTKSPANALVVRFVLPDSPDGAGAQATLGLYVNGARVQSVSLTSAFAWAYGNPETTDATTNTPGDGFARHFYDEARVLLPQDIAAGSTVALQRDASDTAPYYVIDLVDLEEVAPARAQPAKSLSITSYGATGNDATDDGQAIQAAINDAQAKGMDVWIPPGTFHSAATAFRVKGVGVSGAGMWRSTIEGASARFVCAGSACKVSDLALLGATTRRDDSASLAGISGAFGTGSSIENVWIEHFTTGAWIGLNGSAPTRGLLVRGSRFRDTFADGINLCNGTSDSIVEQSSARNTGDDAFASWAFAGASDPANANNVFRFDTAQIPWRANCFAIYGGAGSSIEDDVCADAVTYPGIFIDQEFNAHPFTGTTTVARDTVLRSGGSMYGRQWGALTVAGHDATTPITGVVVDGVDIEDATYAGLFFVGPGSAIDGVALKNLTIGKPGTYGIAVDPSAKGSATASGVVVTSPGTAGLQNGASAAWVFTRQAGDVGW